VRRPAVRRPAVRRPTVLAGALLVPTLALAGLTAGPAGTAYARQPAPAAVRPLATTTTAIAPGLTLSNVTLSGPNKAYVLTAHLTEPTLKPRYLSPGTVGATATVTTQANRAGAIAAVNGDFFDIGVTGAPRGIGIDNGTLVHGPSAGWNDVAALYPSGTSTRGGLAQVFLDGKVTLPAGQALTATNLNSPNLAKDGIGIYNPSWGSGSRDQVLDGATRSRELEVTGGRVTRVSTTPGGKVPEGSVDILGVDAGADALAGVAVGDAVGVNYQPRGDDGATVAIGGNLVLVKDGVIDVPSHPLNPRTAVGFSADGLTMWLVVVDGRTSSSVGMTYLDLANYMKSLGADDALNLDGGGSSTMVTRMPGATALSVRNTPSDGSQRSVANGIGFVSTALPAACWTANLDFTAYPTLAAGAGGAAVTAAQCLLKGGGYDTGGVNPSGVVDASTVAAVRAYQQDHGLPATGSVESHTWTALLSAGSTPTLQSGSTGADVRRLQRSLTAALGRTVGIDGSFGPQTRTAVTDYQKSRTLSADGIAGAQTWTALQAGK
jgi:peptidoglycan hydrolase-like protein with peptidoglycan-binding domain